MKSSDESTPIEDTRCMWCGRRVDPEEEAECVVCRTLRTRIQSMPGISRAMLVSMEGIVL